MSDMHGDGKLGPETDEWETPQKIWDALHRQYHFVVDLSASEKNHKTPQYFSKERPFQYNTDFLRSKRDITWCNPPFSKAAEFFEIIGKTQLRTVAIYKANNLETKTWRSIFKYADWIFLFHTRMQYEQNGLPGHGCKFGSALLGFNGVPIPESSMRETGTLITVWK